MPRVVLAYALVSCVRHLSAYGINPDQTHVNSTNGTNETSTMQLSLHIHIEKTLTRIGGKINQVYIRTFFKGGDQYLVIHLFSFHQMTNN